MSKRLSSKAALVTGGSSGIGLAVARRFHLEGATVSIAGRNRARLDEAAASIGEGVRTHVADVAVVEDIDRMVEEVAALGPLDILFANAGIGRFATLSATTPALFDDIFSINVRGAYFTIQKALPHLRDGASIILTSIAPIAPAWRKPATSAYAASKAAVASLAKTLSVELADRKIRVNAVAPGATRTSIYEAAGASAGVIAERLEKIAKSTPFGRIAEADEIAGAVAFLASNDTTYVTGQEIIIDGGLS